MSISRTLIEMNKIMLGGFVYQYRIKYKPLKQTSKQSKTREDEIVLLPNDIEHKIMRHALCSRCEY